MKIKMKYFKYSKEIVLMLKDRNIFKEINVLIKAQVFLPQPLVVVQTAKLLNSHNK